MAHARVDELTAERIIDHKDSAGNEAMEDLYTMATRIRYRKVATATHNAETSNVVRVVKSLRIIVAPGEHKGNTTVVQARETFDKMSKCRRVVEGLSWTVAGERARHLGLVDA